MNLVRNVIVVAENVSHRQIKAITMKAYEQSHQHPHIRLIGGCVVANEIELALILLEVNV